jgi:hypothetical protein
MNFNIPVIYILVWLISKEVFSYDGERIVIFCILTFIIGTYYFSKASIEKILNANIIKLTEQFSIIIKLESELLLNLKSLLHKYLSLEFKLIQIFNWINIILKNIFVKIFKNKFNFVFNLIKDQLIDLIKLNIKLNLININIQLNQVTDKFYLIFINKLKSVLKHIYFSDFLTLNNLNSYYTDILLLIINKLNYNYNKINTFFILYNRLG